MMDINSISLIISGIVFLISGFVLGYILAKSNFNSQIKALQELSEKEEKKKVEEREKIIETLKGSFSSLSQDALKNSSASFLQLAEENFKRQSENQISALESRKGLIDQSLGTMSEKLGQVTTLVSEFEKERAEKLGALGNQLDSLTATSRTLHTALVNNQARGQWGERMAEDILNLIGFVEDVNYTKQQTIEDEGGKKSRPDFSFLLPNNLRLNMDVKFSLANYLKYLDAEAEIERESYRKDFLKDIRNRIKEVNGRNYIDPLNTVDCVLIFIPNEQIYRFIHEQDHAIIESALKDKVILCSPITLFSILSIIRQATLNFRLEKSSKEILVLLKEFSKQWEAYIKQMGDVETKLKKTQEAFDDLVGKRQKALQKPIDKIDQLTKVSGIEEEIGQLEAS